MFGGFKKDTIKLQGGRSAALEQARGRLMLVSAFFIVIYALIAVRVVDLTLVQGSVSPDRRASLSDSSMPALHRADIVDRNGALLATTIKMASLYVDPVFIDDPVFTAKGLIKIFPDLNYGNVLKKLQSKSRFVWLKRKITPDEQYAVLELGQPGLNFKKEDRRVYPQGGLAAHLVGYTNLDNKGLAGVERSFDSLLEGGQELKLTLDIRLQHVLRREVGRAISEFAARAGAGIIMDVKTGEVLAGVSLPDFDPHDAGNAPDEQRFNRLSLGVYELGSVFKIFSTAALLETQNLPMSTTFDASEPIKVGRFQINDYHAQKRDLTIPEVFMYSSNIGTAHMAEAVGTENLRGFYGDLGLFSKMDIDIDEVGTPILPNPWREVSTLTASYGHGIATTPLQVISAVSTTVNGGTFISPRLVVGEDSAPVSNSLRVMSAKTSTKMRRLMRLTVTDGTGAKAAVSGYRVGGKTGTAEKVGERGYDRKRLISSFVGAFPMNDPQYAIFVMVDEPKGNQASFGYATAGWVAAPAVARVVSAMTSILGLPGQQLSRSDYISAPLRRYVRDKEGKQLVSY